jgi:hypothetical protein
MYTSAEFQTARRALLACSDADRAFLRRWLLRKRRVRKPIELAQAK